MVNSWSQVLHPKSRTHSRGFVAGFSLLLGVGIALAAPGDLDPGFNGGGLLSLNIGSFGASATAIVQQTDGKLVLVGDAAVNPEDDFDFIAVRMTENGFPDDSFGTGGTANADFSGLSDHAFAVIQQSDGKLVLAGSAVVVDGSKDIALARFNADGTLDAAFGDGGRVTLDVGGSRDVAFSVIEQAGGKLVIAGESSAGGAYRSVFARFKADGTLDVTFGTGGTTLVDFGGGSGFLANDIVRQSDGKLVAVGPVFTPAGQDFGIVRLTANGVLDTTFDGDGLLAVDINGGNEEAITVAIQPDDAIVAAGYRARPDGSVFDSALLRLDTDGSPDPTFGNGGIAVIDLGNSSALSAIVVLPDGKLAATGYRDIPDICTDMIVARFSAVGELDTNYGVDGVATADFGEGNTSPCSTGVALVRQVDGKFVAVGSNSLGQFAAARFDDGAASPGVIGLLQTNRSVAETAGSASYTVRRTGGITGTVSVGYASVAGQALSGADFEAHSGTLTWNNGDASDKTITIDLIDDSGIEIDESFSLSLSAPTGGAQLAANDATTTITSDDGPGEIFFALSIFDLFQVIEDDRVISMPVRRARGSSGAVSVNYCTLPGTATAGTDFVATSGTLSWADGNTDVKRIEVEILDDSAAESNESFNIRLSNPTGGATIPRFGGSHFVWILDDDSSSGGGGSVGGSGGDCNGNGGGGGGDGGGGSGGGGSSSNGGGGAVDWLAMFFLFWLCLQHRCQRFLAAVQSR